jgi:hypothetical protein
MRLHLATVLATILTTSALTASAFAQSRTEQIVTIGPWEIKTTYRADKFDGCAMTRTADELGITFARTPEGLLLLLESPKWKLERGKAYPVRLAAGSDAMDAKALAETKAVTITLTDSPFNRKLAAANLLEVRGEGATLRVPLDGSRAALDRLEACYDKNTRENVATNPFIAPSRRP